MSPEAPLPPPPDTEVLYDPPSSLRATIAAWVASGVVVAFALFVVVKVAQGRVMATVALTLGAIILLVPAFLGRRERPLATRKITLHHPSRTLQVTARGRTLSLPQDTITDIFADTALLSGGVSLAVVRLGRKDGPALVLSMRDAGFAQGTARALRAALGLDPPPDPPAAAPPAPPEGPDKPSPKTAPNEPPTNSNATLDKP